MMLEQTKLALHISNNVFDQQILDLIEAGIADLKHCGIQFEATQTTVNEGYTLDYTIEDPLPRQAVITYVRMNMGSPADYDRLAASYAMQKGQMRASIAYSGTEA